jgi:hypothetical protein
MDSDALKSLTLDDIDAAFRSVAADSPTNPANVLAHVTKAKLGLEPLMVLLRQSSEFRMFADDAMAMLTASAADPKVFRGLYLMLLRAVFHAGVLAGYNAAKRQISKDCAGAQAILASVQPG